MSLRPIPKGQAAVAVLLFTGVMVLSALALYKSGKLTSDKMQMQNAADAAAYSMSLVEARDLNYAAYMNRAIVANEVAVGQLVGLASWAFHWRSFADYLMAYDTCCIGPATLGVSTPIMQTITNTAWRVPGEAFINVMTPIANFGTTVLHNINKFYGLAEYGYHIVSVIFAVGSLNEVIRDNAPPGTKLSDFGIITLITHIATYGVLPGLPGDQFATAYSPTKTETPDEFKAGGYGRLASLINDSRDPFTMARGWELRPPGFPIDISFGFGEDFGFMAFDANFWFHLDLSLERKGASELRIDFPAGNINAKSFNWSSADTTGLFFEIGGGFTIKVELLPEPFRFTVFNGGADVFLGNSRLKISISFGGQKTAEDPDCVDRNNQTQADNDADSDPSNDQPLENCIVDGGDGITLVDIPFPTSAPFGAGFTQAGKTTNKLDFTEMSLAPLGPIEPEHYGDAANNLLAWASPGPTGPLPPVGVAAYALPTNDSRTRVNKTYGGLPHYVDTTGNESFLGIGAPNLIIGLVQDEADFDLSNDGTNVENEPTGIFALTEKLADGELGVIAKSELYFSRPLDVTHFARADGQEEYGSAFNPYWQVRLVDTNYPERILALLIQQKQNFITITPPSLPGFGDICDYIPGGC